MFLLISVLALLPRALCQTLSYVESVYYNDPNCELEVSFQALNVVDYCFRDQSTTTGELENTSFMNHFSYVTAATDGSYKLKKVNFQSTDCSGTGVVGVVIPGQTGVCQPIGTTGVYKISTYSGANDVYNVGTFGYREAYYTSATGCATKAQITTEKTYQNNACVSMGDHSVSYSCMPNGIAGAVTTKTYSDLQCNSLTSVVTQPLPLECSQGKNVGSNELNYMYQSCVDQALPTGYILTSSFAASDCSSAAPFMKAYHSVGNCYQKFNSASDTVTGSYLTIYAPSATDPTSFKQKMFNFDDGRCTKNSVKSVAIPFTTTCGGSSTLSTISSYMDGPSITRDHALPLVISYYPTAPDCTRATAPSSEYHFDPNTCIKKSGASVKYSYNNGKFTKTTYVDDKCTVGGTSVVMTDTTCLSHAGEHSNSEQLFESLTYITASPAPAPSSTASKGVTSTTLEIVFGTICGVLLLVLIYQYYLLQQRKLAMSAAEEGLTNKSGTEIENAI